MKNDILKILEKYAESNLIDGRKIPSGKFENLASELEQFFDDEIIKS